MEISTFEKTKVGGVEARGNFKMKASAKAFRILSDSLYQNKIAAVVRELGTNAYDSHVAAGRADRPFYVHVPTSLEPWFSVRDYGIGMAPEVLEELYVTYFDSTKTTSNDFTGCLGLGSKSPFSYSDNFTVTSVWQGKKRIYLARLDSEGMPCIDLISESDSSEEVGIEVRVNISNFPEIGQWKNTISETYSHFETLPNLSDSETANKMFALSNHFKNNLIGERDGIKVYTIGDINYSSKICMGNVSYPMPVASEFFNENAKEIQETILNLAKFYVVVPIGYFDVAASRESLSIDANTKKNLQKMTMVIRDLFLEEMKSRITKISSVYEGILLIDKIKEEYPKVNISNKKIFPLDIEFEGKSIQHLYYEPRVFSRQAIETTIEPKSIVVTLNSLVKPPDKNQNIPSIEEQIAANGNISTSKSNSVDYWFNRSRIGEIKCAKSVYGGRLDFTMEAVIFIDGDKPLIYDRIIKEFCEDEVKKAACSQKEEIEKRLKESGLAQMTVSFALKTIIIRAYEIPGSIEYKRAVSFIEKTYLDDRYGVFYVSDFRDKYKTVRKKGNKKAAGTKTEWSLKTYEFIRSSGYAQADCYMSIELFEKDSDEEILYVDRDGFDWFVGQFMSSRHGYRYRTTYEIFDFFKSLKVELPKIFALTERQKNQLIKKGFSLVPLFDKAEEKLKFELKELKAMPLDTFYNPVNDENEELKSWLQMFEIVKSLDNSECIDWFISNYLIEKSTKNKNYNHLHVQRLSNLGQFLSHFIDGYPHKKEYEKLMEDLSEFKCRQSASAKTGGDLVEKMISENPFLKIFDSLNYDILRSGRSGKWAVIMRETLEQLQKLEIHKK